jgi:hypothetical protein
MFSITARTAGSATQTSNFRFGMAIRLGVDPFGKNRGRHLRQASGINTVLRNTKSFRLFSKEIWSFAETINADRLIRLALAAKPACLDSQAKDFSLTVRERGVSRLS